MLNSRTGKTVVLSLGKGLASINALILSMVLARVFDESDYGTYQQTLLVFAVVSPFLGMGLSNAVYYFLPTAGARSRAYVIENLILLCAAGLGLFVFLIFGGNVLLAKVMNNEALKATLLLTAPVAIFTLPVTSADGCFVARDRTNIAAVFGVVTRLVSLVIILLAIWYVPTVESALVAYVASAAVVFAIAAKLMWSVCEGNPRPSLASMKEQLAFGVPLALGTAVSTISKTIDRLMVSGFTSPAGFAVYTNGAMQVPLVDVVTGSMTSVLMVDYRKLLEDGDTTEVLRLIHRAMIKSATVLIPLMALLLCVAPEFMIVIWGPNYVASAPVFRVYLTLLPVRTLVFGSILIAANKTRLLAGISVVCLAANAFFNWLFINEFGVIGAAVATVLTTYLFGAGIRAWASTVILKCTFRAFIPWAEFGRVVFAAALPVPFTLWFLSAAATFGPHALLLGATTVYSILALMSLSWFGFLDLNVIRQWTMRHLGR